MEDFIKNYLAYTGDTECPTFFHRWCSMSMLGAYLGRQYTLPFGNSNLHTNLYCMLIGVPASRKSTAIKLSKKIIRLAGYDTISADKSSKEKFMLDLAGEDLDGAEATGGNGKYSKAAVESLLDSNLWGDTEDSSATSEMYIACDEFNDFIGNGNIEFISLLGNLWDFEGTFKNRIKNGKSVNIHNPTVSILGGNTPVNFSKAFPADTLGQGFFSRLLLIHGEPTGKKITFPKTPDPGETNEIVTQLQQIKSTATGISTFTHGAELLIDKIYKHWKGIDDSRFESYSGRRLTHLLKLCLIISASKFRTVIDEEVVITANTVLSHTESLMPKALGEFGKSRNGDVTHKIVQIISAASGPVSMKELWMLLSTDLDKINDLSDLLKNLQMADKIQVTEAGFLPMKKVIEVVRTDCLDSSILTEEERNMTL